MSFNFDKGLADGWAIIMRDYPLLADTPGFYEAYKRGYLVGVKDAFTYAVEVRK